jgi:glutathionylspermidine synthase
MERESSVPRPGWQRKLEEIGFSYHSMDGKYWDESVCYSFSAEEIDMLESVTAELHEMCVEAAGTIIERGWFDRLAIPEHTARMIVDSWNRDEPSLYGRFDFSYDGRYPPKLLEYNADTPTSVIECAAAQWFWLEEVKPEMDQFNSLHDKLIARWRQIAADGWIKEPLYFSCVKENEEDLCTVEYLRDTAAQAGLDTALIFTEDIGWDADSQLFADLDGAEMAALFKLYPWEWLIQEDFASHLALNKMQLLEPAWKMLLSNKGILPVLWELFPHHPNLLPAYFNADNFRREYVKKPLLSREGANIVIEKYQRVTSKDEGYGGEGYVYQEYCPLPMFGAGNFPVIGSWIVGGEPAGIGIREDKTLITSNMSRFIPHYFIP